MTEYTIKKAELYNNTGKKLICVKLEQKTQIYFKNKEILKECNKICKMMWKFVKFSKKWSTMVN